MKNAQALVLAVIVAGFVPLAAQAQSGAAPTPDPAAASLETEATEADARSAERLAAHEAERDARRHCLRETGSRLRPRHTADRCTAYGRVWTREDLARTGHVDIVEALRTLDVSIR